MPTDHGLYRVQNRLLGDIDEMVRTSAFIFSRFMVPIDGLPGFRLEYRYKANYYPPIEMNASGRGELKESVSTERIKRQPTISACAWPSQARNVLVLPKER